MENTITMNTPAGRITGLDQGTHYEFRGIPYALPPTGLRRWHKPEPLTEALDLEAFTFPPAGPQQDMSQDPFYGREFYDDENFMPAELSEDCLYLNIWLPKEAADKPYPIAVWFHGGAFDHGFSYEKEFDGAALAQQGIILVTVGYRLGPFGFLYLPERISQDGFAGNYGQYDQLAALEWVKANLPAFGGDPDNVTIFGQSAGSFSVQNLLHLAQDRELFHKVILQSGCGEPQGMALTLSPKQAEKITSQLFKQLKIKSVQELEQLDTQTIMNAAWKVAKRHSGLIYLPTADEDNLAAKFQSRMPAMPAMLGAVSEDIASSKSKPVLLEEAKKMAETLGSSRSYVYYFTHPLPGSNDGAWHSSELWYVFNTLNRCWRPFTEEDHKLADLMTRHWAQFMKTGSPDLPDSPWPAFTDQKVKVFE